LIYEIYYQLIGTKYCLKVIAQFQSSYFKLGCQQRRISKEATTSSTITSAIGDAIDQCVSTNVICGNRLTLCSDLNSDNEDSCNICSDSKNISEMKEIVDDSDSIRSSLSHDSCLETIDITNNIILTNNKKTNPNDENNINNNIGYDNDVLNDNLCTIPIISDMYANYQHQYANYQSLFNTYHSTIPWQEKTPIIIGTDESIDNISTFSKQVNNNFYKNLNIKKRMLISVPVTLSSMETEPAMKYMKYLQYQTIL
jgi:hypothetical protein